jgi:hypothetical protein
MLDTSRLWRSLLAVMMLVLVTLACDRSSSPQAAATNTPYPTYTPHPTYTPSVAPTKATDSPELVSRIGDTIPEVGADRHGLSMALLAWVESDIAVGGPYVGDEFYTFTAKPGMKFIILVFEFRNNWIREQYTPYLDEGELLTDKGYFYRVWSPPLGVHSEEYMPRLSTEEGMRELGSSGGFVKLLPEESVEGCVVFEIPGDQEPEEMRLSQVPVAITLD